MALIFTSQFLPIAYNAVPGTWIWREGYTSRDIECLREAGEIITAMRRGDDGKMELVAKLSQAAQRRERAA
jgi:hypothetical protein